MAFLLFAWWGACLFSETSEKLKTDVLSTAGGRKIVVYKTPEAKKNYEKKQGLKKAGGRKVKDLDFLNASVVEVATGVGVDMLLEVDEVARIEDDLVIQLDKQKLSSNPKDQLVPWGVIRIGSEGAWQNVNGPRASVAVLDTGIDLDHPDLMANIKGSINTINPELTAEDDNGHGTHVAGTIAALNNKLGVVGVAPKTKIYAAKTFSASGGGYLSDILEGLYWSMESQVDIVNMSFSTPYDISSLRETIEMVDRAGILMVGSTGNRRSRVGYPAAYESVIAVSASTEEDAFAWFANRGPEVNVAAPGMAIYSTHLNGGYASMAGTSMAAPHVAGVVSLLLSTPVGSSDVNGDGKWNREEVVARLESTAEDLGYEGRDDYFGAGLVKADKAVIH